MLRLLPDEKTTGTQSEVFSRLILIKVGAVLSSLKTFKGSLLFVFITRNEREREKYCWHHLNLKLDCDRFTLKTVSKLLALWMLIGIILSQLYQT